MQPDPSAILISVLERLRLLEGILDEVPGRNEIEAVLVWSIRRGRVWKPKEWDFSTSSRN